MRMQLGRNGVPALIGGEQELPHEVEWPLAQQIIEFGLR